MNDPQKSFQVGDRVRIVALPAYVKTADPMPMLRPPSAIALQEEGTVVDRRPGNYWVVRLSGGTFLLESEYLAPVEVSQTREN